MTTTSATASLPAFWKSFWKALRDSGWFDWKEKPGKVLIPKEAPQQATPPKVEEKKPVA